MIFFIVFFLRSVHFCLAPKLLILLAEFYSSTCLVQFTCKQFKEYEVHKLNFIHFLIRKYLIDKYLKYERFQLNYRVMAADSSDGVMTAEEMRRYLFSEVKTSYADHELQEMFTALDQDNDGKVKMEDFVRLLATENSVDVQDESPNCAEYCVIL